jgi:hypothetical protein
LLKTATTTTHPALQERAVVASAGDLVAGLSWERHAVTVEIGAPDSRVFKGIWRDVYMLYRVSLRSGDGG